MTGDQAKDIALFRYQVIAPLLHLDGRRGALRRQIRRLVEQTHDHPFKGAIRVGFGFSIRIAVCVSFCKSICIFVAIGFAQP